MFRIMSFLLCVMTGTTAMAQQGPLTRIYGGFLGEIEMKDTLSDHGSGLILSCGADGVSLRAVIHHQDTGRPSLFKGVEKMRARVVFVAQSTTGDRAYFGYQGEGVNNSSSRFLIDYTGPGGKTKHLTEYDSFDRFLGVLMADQATVTIWAKAVNNKGNLSTDLVQSTREIDRAKHLQVNRRAAMARFCKLAHQKRFHEIDAPKCLSYERSENVLIRTGYEHDVNLISKNSYRGFSGELLLYGTGTNLRYKGRNEVEPRSGRLEITQRDTLTLRYALPGFKPDVDDTLKSLLGDDRFSQALAADPVELILRLPNGQIVGGDGISASTVKLPDKLLLTLMRGTTLTVEGKSKNGVIDFSETLDVRELRTRYRDMLRQKDEQAKAILAGNVCRKSTDKLQFVFE